MVTQWHQCPHPREGDEGGFSSRGIGKSQDPNDALQPRSEAAVRTPLQQYAAEHVSYRLIAVIARTKLPPVVIEKVKGALKTKCEKLHAEVNEAIDAAEALCKARGITRLATYDTEPLAAPFQV